MRRIIQRIRDVIARPDLVIPLAGSQAVVDSNTIAEYLDGVLPPDRAAEIEELCLAADKYLAEVAGCREVLQAGSQAGAWEPESSKRQGLELPSPAAFRRMYALLPDPTGRAGQTGHAAVGQVGQPFRGRRRWAMVGSVLAVACLLLGVCLYRDLAPNFQLGDQSREPGREEADGAPFAAKESPPSKGEAERHRPAVKARVPSQLGNVVTAGVTSKGLLRRQGLSKEKIWRAVPADAIVSIDDQLLSLPGYQSEIRLDNGVRLRLLGSLPPLPIPEERGMDEMGGPAILASAIRLRSTPGIDLDLQLSRGRITVANDKPQGEARVRVRFADEIWDLTLAAPGSEASLELGRYYPPGSGMELGAEEPAAEAHLFVLHGEVRLQVRYDSYMLREPPGPAEFSWNNVGAVSRRPQELQQLPPWIKSPAVSEDVQQALANFQAHLTSITPPSPLAAPINGADPVVSLLKETLNEPVVASRAVAVYGLGAIDEFPVLLEVLGNERQFAEVRRAAVVALRHWMSRDAENGRKLFEAVKKVYSSSTAEIVHHLLHGFSQAQLQQPAVYANLIAYLQHADLPVRELAFSHLRGLVHEGRAISYDPVGDPAQRRRAIEEWKKLIPEGAVPKR